MNVKRALLRTAIGLATFSAVATVVIGVAHTPWGRPLLELPLLRGMASRAGCPVGSIEPAAFEHVRQTKLKTEIGSRTAKAHPALAFHFGRTRRADVQLWTRAQGMSCKAGSVASVLQCSPATPGAAAPITSLRLQFDGDDRLVSVDLFRSTGSAEALVQRFVELGQELDARVGPPTSSVGVPTVTYLRQAPLRTVTRDYRYRDYVARATLLNLGKRGLKLREHYQWLAPGTSRDPA